MPSSLARRANVPEVAGREGAPSLIPRHTYAIQCFRSDWPPYWATCGRPESTLVQTWRHQLLARGRPALWLQDLHGTLLCHMVWLMANAADLTRSYPIREDSGCMEAGVNHLPEHTSNCTVRQPVTGHRLANNRVTSCTWLATLMRMCRVVRAQNINLV